MVLLKILRFFKNAIFPYKKHTQYVATLKQIMETIEKTGEAVATFEKLLCDVAELWATGGCQQA